MNRAATRDESEPLPSPRSAGRPKPARRVRERVGTWLALFLWMIAPALAAVWVPTHTETYMTAGSWTVGWTDGSWGWDWVDPETVPQTVPGYWGEETVPGHEETQWIEGGWNAQWSDGYWDTQWVDAHPESVWTDGHWDDVWTDGWTDEEGNWNEGYWSQNWTEGAWDTVWVEGDWSSTWVEGTWSNVWSDGHNEPVWVDGYTTPVWVEETVEYVVVAGHYEWTWHDGYWGLVEVPPQPVTVTIEGHWEGEWTWTTSDTYGEWSEWSWAPSTDSQPGGVVFTQTGSRVRSHVHYESNEAGDIQNFTSGPEYDPGTQTAVGTGAVVVIWTAFDEPGSWSGNPPWTPESATVALNVQFTQTSSGSSRVHQTGERGSNGQVRNLSSYVEGGGPNQTQVAVGTGTAGTGGVASAPSITSAAAIGASAGQAQTYLISATNNPTSYGLSWVTGAPRYASFDAQLGTVTLTATQPGTYKFAVTATNAAGTSSSQLVSFNVGGFALTEAPDFSLPGGVNPVGMLLPIHSWGLQNYGNNLNVTGYPNIAGQASFDVRVSSSWSKGNAGSQAIKVLILDTGVQSSPAHPALNRIADTKNFTADRPAGDAGQPYSDNPAIVFDSNNLKDTTANRALWTRRLRADGEQHGTKIASIVAGLMLKSGDPYDRAAFGVAPGVNILSARVIYVQAVEFTSHVVNGEQRLVKIEPKYDLDHAKLIEALEWGEAQGARVSNSSFATSFPSTAVAAAYADTRGAALAEIDVTSQYSGTADRGMVHFAATGNDNRAELRYPASIPAVNAVGAVHINAGRWVAPQDPGDPIAPEVGSNYGAGIDFVAPGHQILTAQPTWITRDPWNATVGDGYTSYWTIRGWYGGGSVPNERFANSGTSLASPHAAGVAALVLSQNPKWTAAAVEARMQATARPMSGAGYSTEFGWGMVDAEAATAPGVWNLVNLSTRAQVNTGEEYLGMGFVLTGSDTKRMLVRAAGPKLAAFGLSGVLTNPAISLVRQSDGATVASNTGWMTAPNVAEIRDAAVAASAFPFDEGSTDSAMLVDLPPGAYTANITGVGGTAGIALAELYSVSASRDAARLVNISSRAFVGAGQSVMIPGISINADSARSLLVRAIGPSLPGVSGRLANPHITLWRLPSDAPPQVVKSNDNWGSEPNWPTIRGFAQSVGAFSLDLNSLDSAMLVELPRGSYTVEVSGVAGTSGVCLVEVYTTAN